MMSSGLVPHGWQAVALAPIVISLMPKMRAKPVAALPCALTSTAFTGLQPGMFALQEVATVFVTFVTPRTGFSAKYSFAFVRRVGGRRQRLRAGERRGVDRRLQLALGVPAEAEVDDQRGSAEQHDQRHDHHDDRLPALALVTHVSKSLHAQPPLGIRSEYRTVGKRRTPLTWGISHPYGAQLGRGHQLTVTPCR